MSTAVDAAFEELVSHGDTADYRHALCDLCYPGAVDLPAEIQTICGLRMRPEAWQAGRQPGRPKCSTCAFGTGWPCGHA